MFIQKNFFQWIFNEFSMTPILNKIFSSVRKQWLNAYHLKYRILQRGSSYCMQVHWPVYIKIKQRELGTELILYKMVPDKNPTKMSIFQISCILFKFLRSSELPRVAKSASPGVFSMPEMGTLMTKKSRQIQKTVVECEASCNEEILTHYLSTLPTPARVHLKHIKENWTFSGPPNTGEYTHLFET